MWELRRFFGGTFSEVRFWNCVSWDAFPEVRRARGKGRRGRRPLRMHLGGRRKKHNPTTRTAERQRLIEAHQISVRKRRPGQFRDARNAYSNARQRLAQTSFSLLDRPRPVFSFSPGEKEKMGGGEGPAIPIAEPPVLVRAPPTNPLVKENWICYNNETRATPRQGKERTFS